jgi:hypothetical protein
VCYIDHYFREVRGSPGDSICIHKGTLVDCDNCHRQVQNHLNIFLEETSDVRSVQHQHSETVRKMRKIEELQLLISERWPQLRKRAERENDSEKLIAIVEDIDDLLFILEMRVSSLETEKHHPRPNHHLRAHNFKAKTVHN